MPTSVNNKCIFCENQVIIKPKIENYSHCICKICGEYFYSDLFEYDDMDSEDYERNRHKLQGYIYEINHNNRNDKVELFKQIKQNIITTDYEKEIILNNPIIPNEWDVDGRIIKFLNYLYDLTEYPGQEVDIGSSEKLFPMLYARNGEELRFIWGVLNSRKLISGLTMNVGAQRSISFVNNGLHLTKKGLEEIRGHVKNKKQIFIAMAFTSEMLEIFNDEVKNQVYEATGFLLKLVSDEDHNNLIDDQIIAEINRSAAVIADFSDNNRGAYYEAGYAAGISIEVIFICKKDSFHNQDKSKTPHFDVEHKNFIIWENKSELIKRLIDRINATLNKKNH